MRGLNPLTGEELWRFTGLENPLISTPTTNFGYCFCFTGKEFVAIRLGGRGDVTQSHKVWAVPLEAQFISPLYVTGMLFVVTDQGNLICFDWRDGKRIHEQQLSKNSASYAAPLLSANRIYFPLESEGVVVCEATSKASLVSQNQIEDDSNPVRASLAVSGNRLFLRNEKFVYCLANSKKAPRKIARTSFKNNSELIVPELINQELSYPKN